MGEVLWTKDQQWALQHTPTGSVLGSQRPLTPESSTTTVIQTTPFTRYWNKAVTVVAFGGHPMKAIVQVETSTLKHVCSSKVPSFFLDENSPGKV